MSNTLAYNIKGILNDSSATEVIPLNGQAHEVELYITNGAKKYIVAPTAIVSLVIEDSLSDWPVRGELIVFYSNDLAEYLNNFIFRNDGEDLLRLRIYPKDLAIRGLPSLNLTKKLWEQNHIFSIYDFNDVTPQDKGNPMSESLKKMKRFKFWDIRYQTLITRNIEYTTTNSSPNFNSTPEPEKYLDINRSITTDQAMKEIIETAFEKDEILSRTGSEEEWDKGATQIFYTSPASYNAYEDLATVYDRHCSNKVVGDGTVGNDYSLLTIEHEENGIGYFALKPLLKYFENAGSGETPGPYQLEHFFLQNDIKNDDRSIGLWRSPLSLNLGDRDLTFRDYSTIIKYEFVDISPATNTLNYVNLPVYSFDFKERTFNVEFQTHSLDNATSVFQQYASSLFRHNSQGSNASSLLIQNSNSSKLKNYSVAPVFSVYGDTTEEGIKERNADGLHNLLHTGLFQNTCINFTVPGLTMRQPGRFIAIDRPEGSIDNTFDDKLCGQWFVIHVTHTISNQAYYNNITAVKIHRYKAEAFFDSINSASNQPPQIGVNASAPPSQASIAQGVAPGL